MTLNDGFIKWDGFINLLKKDEVLALLPHLLYQRIQLKMFFKYEK